jgi:hypothetical protein
MAFTNFCKIIYKNLALFQNLALILVLKKWHCIILNILHSTLMVSETLFLHPFIKFAFDMSILADDGKPENSKS